MRLRLRLRQRQRQTEKQRTIQTNNYVCCYRHHTLSFSPQHTCVVNGRKEGETRKKKKKKNAKKKHTQPQQQQQNKCQRTRCGAGAGLQGGACRVGGGADEFSDDRSFIMNEILCEEQNMEHGIGRARVCGWVCVCGCVWVCMGGWGGEGGGGGGGVV